MIYYVVQRKGKNWFSCFMDNDNKKHYLNIYGKCLKLERLFSILSDAEKACKRHYQSLDTNEPYDVIVSEVSQES